MKTTPSIEHASSTRAAPLRAALVGLYLLILAPVMPAHAGKESITVPVTEPQPATLGAELFTPRGSGPYPAVILLHGCGGITPNVPAWAQWLQSEGYAALVLDSFGGRNIRNLCGGSAQLTGKIRAADVFAAAAQLSTMGSIDANRIAAIGFSHGGWTIMEAWRAAPSHPEQKIRAMIAFYPAGCTGGLAAPSAPPLLLLVGGRDDWTPAEPCQKLAETAKEAGRPVTLVLYPDAFHHFDGADLKRPVYVSAARGGKGATMAYNPSAHEDSEKQVKRFLEANLAR